MRQTMGQQLHAKAIGIGLILCAALWMSTSAIAAGLGQMTIRSLLGETLVADITLVTRDRSELDGLTARIATVNAHRQAGIPYAVAALGLRAAIQSGNDGQSFIRVTSVRPITEPAVRLLLELTGPDAQTLREYSALFEPPESQRR